MIVDIDKYLHNAQMRYQNIANQICKEWIGIISDNKVFKYHIMIDDFTTIITIWVSQSWLEFLEEQLPTDIYNYNIDNIRYNWDKEIEYFIKNLQRDLQISEQKISLQNNPILKGYNPKLFNLRISKDNNIFDASDYNFFVIGNADNGTSIFIQLTDE